MAGSAQTVKTRQARETDIRGLLQEKKPLDIKIQDFATMLAEFLGNALVSVSLFDPELEEFFLRGSTQRIRSSGEVLRYAAEGTMPALAIRERRPIWLREVHRPPASGEQAEHYLFPLVAEQEVLGVVSIEHTSAQGLNPVRVDSARRLINEFAAFLGKVRREDGMSLKMTRLSAISEAGVTLISASTVADLLPMVTAVSTLIMGAEGAVIRLWDKKSSQYTLRDVYGFKDKARLKEILLLEQAAVNVMHAAGAAILAKDAPADPRFAKVAGTVSTFICHPIRSGGVALGTLTVVNKAAASVVVPPYFTEEDLEYFGRLVQYIGKAVGIALSRQEQEELRERDEATGLPNLRYFRGRLLAEISRAQRFHGRILTATCSFRSAGPDGQPGDALPDALLGPLAATLRDAIREYDVIARMELGRLAVIFPQAEDGTLNAVARLERAVSVHLEDLVKEGVAVSPEVVYTHAVYPDDGDTDEEILNVLAGERKRKKSGGEWQDHDLVIGALRSKELFFGLAENQLERVASIAELKVFKAGEEIFREGDPANAIFIVQTGEADIYKEKEEGRKIKLASIGAGAVFGEMTLVHKESRSATAIASRDCSVIVLHNIHLTEVFAQDRDILAMMALNIARILSKRLRKASDAYSNLYMNEVARADAANE